jgi:tetratricopeptide (TPR) repeat protein
VNQLQATVACDEFAAETVSAELHLSVPMPDVNQSIPVSASFCLIVRNEQDNLPRCLTSVAGLGLDIVVADTGSSDGTPEIARRFGARVVDFPWCDDFAAARNETLRHARGDWIFWLDADESLDPTQRDKFRALLASLRPEPVAYVMTQRSLGPGGTAGMRVPQVRLFRRDPAIHWEYRVHEQLQPSLQRAGHALCWTDIVITHTGYQDPAVHVRKLERNLRLLRLDQADHPDDAFTLYNLGVACSGLGRHAEALPLLRRSLEGSLPTDSFRLQLHVALVRAHQAVGQHPEARAACQAGLLDAPHHPQLLFLDGLVRQGAGDLGGAEECWRQLLAQGDFTQERHPGALHEGGAVLPGRFLEVDENLPHSARQQLGRLYQHQGRTTEAESLWRQAVGERPDEPSAWQGLADVYLSQGRWDELEQVAVRLGSLPGEAENAAVLRARACLSRKEFGAARRLLEGVIARAPRAVPPRLFLTHALLQEGGDPAAAEQALRALLDLDPSQSEAWRNLAVLLRHQQRPAEAIAVCQTARTRGAEDAELVLLHGLLLHDAGELAQAEACLLRLLEPKPAPSPPNGAREPRQSQARRVRARHHLALLCRQQGRLAEAESHWRAALADMPETPAIWVGLGELCLMQGRHAEVEAILARLEAHPPAAEAARPLRARLHLERQEYGAARQLLEGWIAREPHAPQPRRLLSYVLLQQGTDRAAAEKALRALLALAPADAEARHNLAVLLRRQG